MGLTQGIACVCILFSGAGMLVYAILGLMNNTITGELGFGFALSGVIALILGAIIGATNN